MGTPVCVAFCVWVGGAPVGVGVLFCLWQIAVT